MSYDLSLVNKKGEVFNLDHAHIGGTMPVGGYYKTDFNITYNYSKYFYKYIE